MTRLLLLVLLLGQLGAASQTTDSLSTITFRYTRGHYSFVEPGRHAFTEILEYTKSHAGQFVLTRHLQLHRIYSKAIGMLVTDTIRKQTGARITAQQVGVLLEELNTTKNNFNFAFVKPHLKPITRKRIRSAAKKHGLLENLKNLDPKDRRTAISALKRFHLLDTFLTRINPTSKPELVMTDSWHFLFITCITPIDTIEYRSNLHNLLSQPIYEFRNNRYEARAVNLQVNVALRNLLPKRARLRSAVGLNEVVEEYVRWYAENL